MLGKFIVMAEEVWWVADEAMSTGWVSLVAVKDGSVGVHRNISIKTRRRTRIVYVNLNKKL